MRPTLGESLLALIAVFAPLSLLSFGGGNVVIAEIAHQSVGVRHWTSERDFADLFALSRAAPGPGSMLATIIGWKIAGVGGALVATIAFYLPSSLLLFVVAKVWSRWQGSAWHQAVERGMAPIAAGLLLAAGIAVLRASPGGPLVWVAAGIATAAFLRWPKLHPVAIFMLAGALFGVIDLLRGPL
jgi:chromate transporter